MDAQEKKEGIAKRYSLKGGIRFDDSYDNKYLLHCGMKRGEPHSKSANAEVQEPGHLKKLKTDQSKD